jgi:hypothetical protein
VCPDAVPVLGSLIPLAKMEQLMLKNGDNVHPIMHYLNDYIKITDEPAFVFWMCNDPTVMIFDVKIVQAMFTT